MRFIFILQSYYGTGRKILSPINGSPDIFFSGTERLKYTSFSITVISGFVTVVLLTITCIFALKVVMANDNHFTVGNVQIGSIVASVLNAIQIQVFNWIYSDYALWLNRIENHRTDTDYENSLIAKTFIFQFVNSFASLFYIGFLKPFIPATDPCIGGCMNELRAQLGTIFIMQLFVGNMTAVGIPGIQAYIKQR